MRLIIVRHGQTRSNEKEIILGHKNEALNDKGKKQSEVIGHRLKEEKIDFLYASDLIRAVQTAKEIARHHPSLKIIKSKELRERNFGRYDGRNKHLFKEETMKIVIREKIHFSDFKPQKGESLKEVQERMKSFYQTLLKKHRGKTVVVVTHGGVIATFLLYLLNKSFEF